MVKTRMGLLDLRVQTTALHNSLRGARVTNIYDAQNGRTYILKLSVPPSRVQHSQTHPTSVSSTEADSSDRLSPASSSHEFSSQEPSYHRSSSTTWEKRLLLLESGVRVHMTEFDREKDVPSGFCLKLRKHIRARRLDAIRQLGDGGDRILDLVFSAEGQTSAHLIVEAFSGGNIILTDKDYNILTLLRTYRISDTETDARVAVRERYRIEGARRQTKLDEAAFQATANRILDNLPDEGAIAAASTRNFRKKLQAMTIARKALAVELALEPSLIEHALLEAGFEADVSVEDFHKGNGVERTFQRLQEVEQDITRLLKGGCLKGYIISNVKEVNGEPREEYNEFAPYLFAQYRQKSYKSFESFDEAADEFFSSLEARRAETAKLKRENAAFKKVDKLAAELHGQVAVFENARDMSWERARAIERNVVEVEAAITVIRSAIAASVPWEGLSKMIEDEKKSGNPVAEIIHSLQLEKNEVTLMLEDSFGAEEDEKFEYDNMDDEGKDKQNDESNAEDSDESDEYDNSQQFKASAETRKVLLVAVDLDLGAHANARRHYELRKNAAEKMEKAAEASGRTLKAASRKAVSEARKLEAQAAAASIKARRKANWFEKFYWFVSSENYLIVAGRDPQQNELLVKRYLGPADAYVHADVQGASSVIVKNRKLPGCTSHAEIPQMTLEQAGTFAMCRSAAWDSKTVTSAWWVRASQVSKTAPSGAYLSPGSFSIRGKKNFLNPSQLMMGFAFLFKIDESCVANHEGERAVRGLDLLQAVRQDDKLQVAHSDLPQSADEETEDTSPLDPLIKTKGTEEVLADDFLLSASDSDALQSAYASAKMPEADKIPAGNSQVNPNAPEFQSSNRGKAKDAKAPRANKRHLSAKERRALRSARNTSSDEGHTQQEKQSENAELAMPVEMHQQDNANANANASASKSNPPLPRGRKHKLKKMKKYKDQDDEERRIALAILGSKPIKEQDISSQIANAEADKVDVGADNEEEVADIRKPKILREERQEVMRLLEEEGLIELNRLEQETVVLLDMLTATPVPDDKVQYALPVCAPYSALSNYRYRAKLMPGNTKRGKAYRAAVALFIRQAEKDLTKFKQERDSLRISPENDGIHGMLGNVKIMAPGLAEAQKSIQKTKKVASKKAKRKS